MASHAAVAIATYEAFGAPIQGAQLGIVVRRYADGLKALGWPADATLDHVLEILQV